MVQRTPINVLNVHSNTQPRVGLDGDGELSRQGGVKRKRADEEKRGDDPTRESTELAKSKRVRPTDYLSAMPHDMIFERICLI
ncbi:hypothetical protein PM082_012356 [Marasmius tenuissimus]|nr:hypothetical protein PM082_012356 [Marasmius tenuissimus]